MSDLRVYFEKQMDRLCGVHCLNSLLQGPVFTQADLNKYAAELDKEESALLATDPMAAKAPRSMTIASLSNRPKSHNVDDTGYFSLGVLEKALKAKYGFAVENAARKDVIQRIDREGLDHQDGFVIHLKDHWFSARAIPNANHPAVREWFFLDSLKAGPVAVSENELWGTLLGLIQSGNGNVFIITGGKLPFPMAQKPPILRANQYYLNRQEIEKRHSSAIDGGSDSGSTQLFTVVDPKAKAAGTDWSRLGAGQSLGGKSGVAPSFANDDDDIQRALRESIKDMITTLPQPKQEPCASEPASNVVSIMVRFPSGQRQVRKFALNIDSVTDLCVWLEFVAGNAGVSLVTLPEYSLVGTMDMRGWKLTRNAQGSFRLTRPGYGDASVELTGKKLLSDIGLRAGQEPLNLLY